MGGRGLLLVALLIGLSAAGSAVAQGMGPRDPGPAMEEPRDPPRGGPRVGPAGPPAGLTQGGGRLPPRGKLVMLSKPRR